MSVESWKAFFDIGTIVLLLLTGVFAAGIFFTGNIINDRQSEQLRHFDKELTSAKTELAKAQRESAEAQLELRRNIEFTATPRRIIIGSRDNDEEIRAPKLKALEKFAGTQVLVMVIAGDNEAQVLAIDIAGILSRSGWQAKVTELPVSIPQTYISNGVQLRTVIKFTEGGLKRAGQSNLLPTPPAVAAAIDFLNLDLGPPRGPAGAVRWSPDCIYPSGNHIGLARYGFNIPDGWIVITVGAKPAFEFFISHNPPVAPAEKK